MFKVDMELFEVDINLVVEDMILVMEDMDIVVEDMDFVMEDNRLVENNNVFVVEDKKLFWYIVDNHHEVNVIFMEDLVLILEGLPIFLHFRILEVLFQLELN